MKNFGVFGSRGNTNINSSESIYILDPRRIFLGIAMGIIFQGILLGIIGWGLEATSTGVLLSLVLMGIGDAFFIATATYTSRLYLREEMVDMASLFASYNPQILNAGGPMVQNAMSAVKEGRAEAMHYATLIGELERLQTILQNQTAPIESAPARAPIPGLPSSGNVTFTPFIDGE